MNGSQTVSQDSQQYVSFTLEKEEYGIPILHVREIIRYENLTRIPQSAQYVEGVLNLRGQVIPVADLRRRFGLAEIQHDNSTRIVVVELDDRVIGMLVDSVSEVQSIEERQIEPLPPLGAKIDSQFIRGVGKLDNRLIILLDLNQAFHTSEENLMAEQAQKEN
ncbi:MAG TPA: chemotaxis protein CheW [bacterium]|nr:chemotaxis protein CheW [bacterium]